MTAKRYAKSDYKYWKSKLIHKKYTYAGKSFAQADYSVRIQKGGRRQVFSLHSRNKEIAAQKACEIYLHLIHHAWNDTLEKYMPRGDVRVESPTVGEFIEEVRLHSKVRESTIVSYERKFRRLVAEVCKIKFDKSKYFAGTGSNAFRAKIDEVSLSDLSPAKINAWMRKYISRAKDEEEIRSRKITVNSIIRNSKSLFSPKLLVFVACEYAGKKTVSSKDGLANLKGRLVIPHNPFEDVSLEKVGKRKYNAKRAGIDIRMIFSSAQKELIKHGPDQYKIFLLAVVAGLRRGEIDCLEWKHIDFNDRTINVMATADYQLKSSDSEDNVAIDRYTAEMLLKLLKKSKGKYVVDSLRPPSTPREPTDYRCSSQYRKLCKWLRQQGVTANRPIHALRQEAISTIVKKDGIHAGSAFARHADIRITSDVYAENRIRSEVDTSEFLSQGP
jgi:integrase